MRDRSFWLGWTLLALSVGWGAWKHPELLSMSALTFLGAFALLVLAALAHLAARAVAARIALRRSPVPKWLGITLWWVGMGALWIAFWLDDLHRARFRLILACIPASAVAFAVVFRVGEALSGRAHPVPWFRLLAAGAMLGLSGVWVAMVWRSDNGCTGVSASYSMTLFFTGLALYGFGPSVLARLIQHTTAPSPADAGFALRRLIATKRGGERGDLG